MVLIAIIFFYAAWTALNGFIANEKGKNVAACVLLSLLFSPLFIYMYLLATPNTPKEVESVPENMSRLREIMP